MTQLHVPVSSGEVWVDDTGGGGPTLLLLHPGVGDSQIWEPMMPLLTERFRVIRYDVRGYGRSPAPDGPYNLLDDLTAVVDHFGLDQFGLVGCSMGGGTAIGLALEQPDRVSGMVLVCPAIPGYELSPDPQLEAEFDAATSPEALLSLSLRVWAAAGVDDPAAVAQLRSAIRGWQGQSRYRLPEAPVFKRLAELTVPTVIMVGDLDRAALIEANEEAVRHIPDGELIWLPGADHMPPLRCPETIAEQITARFAGMQQHNPHHGDTKTA